MAIGKLNISRGHQLAGEPAPQPHLALVPQQGEPAAASEPAVALAAPAGHLLAHERLALLERLVSLAAQGALTEAEFAAEKALILGVSAEPAVALSGTRSLAARPANARAKGPSLLARMFSWKFLPVGAVVGLALSFALQPDETMRLFDQAVRALAG
jgi:hypothetical protein